MYQPQEPTFRFKCFCAMLSVSKILQWFSVLFTKQFFKYYERQILSRISSSMFRILFYSESSDYPRNEEKS